MSDPGFSHRGYTAEYQWDEATQRFRGRVGRIGPLVSFSGRTRDEAQRDFESAVHAYVNACREQGFEPDPPGGPLVVDLVAPPLGSPVARLLFRSVHIAVFERAGDAIARVEGHIHADVATDGEVSPNCLIRFRQVARFRASAGPGDEIEGPTGYAGPPLETVELKRACLAAVALSLKNVLPVKEIVSMRESVRAIRLVLDVPLVERNSG